MQDHVCPGYYRYAERLLQKASLPSDESMTSKRSKREIARPQGRVLRGRRQRSPATSGSVDEDIPPVGEYVDRDTGSCGDDDGSSNDVGQMETNSLTVRLGGVDSPGTANPGDLRAADATFARG